MLHFSENSTLAIFEDLLRDLKERLTAARDHYPNSHERFYRAALRVSQQIEEQLVNRSRICDTNETKNLVNEAVSVLRHITSFVSTATESKVKQYENTSKRVSLLFSVEVILKTHFVK